MSKPIEFEGAEVVRELTEGAVARATARGIVTVKGKLVKAADQDFIDSFRDRALARGEDWFIVLVSGYDQDDPDPDSEEQWSVADGDPEHQGVFRSLTDAKGWAEEVFGGDEEEDIPEGRHWVVIYDARNDEWYGYKLTEVTKHPRMLIRKLSVEARRPAR
jgi:hypothetical protein